MDKFVQASSRYNICLERYTVVRGGAQLSGEMVRSCAERCTVISGDTKFSGRCTFVRGGYIAVWEGTQLSVPGRNTEVLKGTQFSEEVHSCPGTWTVFQSITHLILGADTKVHNYTERCTIVRRSAQ